MNISNNYKAKTGNQVIIYIVYRALQEAQETFGVDFDYDEFTKYDEDEYDEEEEEEDDYVDDDAEEGKRYFTKIIRKKNLQ